MAAIVDPVSPAQSSSTMCSYADNFWGPWNEQDPFRGFSVLVGHMKNSAFHFSSTVFAAGP